MGVKYERLLGLSANRIYIELATRLAKIDGVFYFGHGLADRWFGVSGMLMTPQNVKLLEDKIAVAISCYTGRILGRLAVNEGGARAYIGFTDTVYAAFPEAEHNYLADFIALWIGMPILLVSGKTAGEAVNWFVEQSNKFRELYMSKYPDWINADWYADAVDWNAKHLILHGDNNATLDTIVEVSQMDKRELKKTAYSILLGLGIPVALIAYAAYTGYKYYEKHKREKRR